MTITPWDKNISKINTKGIGSIREKYLNKIGISSMKDISLLKGKEFFLIVIEDFKKGILSPDDLSDFGSEIFGWVGKKYPKSELFQVSLAASELSFYIRAKGSYENLPWYLEEIDKFYERNK